MSSFSLSHNTFMDMNTHMCIYIYIYIYIDKDENEQIHMFGWAGYWDFQKLQKICCWNINNDKDWSM